jgi:hypothetical protein
MNRKEWIEHCIEKTIAERNNRIDAINNEQHVLNARRAGIYARYQVKLNELQKELDSLNGRSSGFSHP